MIYRRPAVLSLAGLLTLLAGQALAQVPPAMDRIPADAPVIAAIKSLASFESNLTAAAKAMNLPEEALAGLGMAKQVLGMPGVNAEGSAAIGLMGTPKPEDEQGPMVIVVPVKDYGAFAKNFGGTGAGLEELQFQGETMFLKDIGGGFAAMGPRKDVVERFKGAAGSKGAFEKLMGPTGKAVADANDTFVLANFQALAPGMKEGYEGLKSQMEMFAQFGGQDAEAMKGSMMMLDALAEGFLRDGQAGVIGFAADKGGIKLDVAAQFKEGSEVAGFFSDKGKAGSMMGSVPSMPFLLAGSFDVTSPGMRKLVKNSIDLSKKANPQAADAMSLTASMLNNVDKIDGQSFVFGTSPGGITGGLLVNSSVFIKTSDPAAIAKAYKDDTLAMNGKTVSGMTYTTTYESGVKAGERTVDVWSMRVKFDPKDPNAAQMQQVQMAMFGMSGGPSGYLTPAKGGVVMTMARNPTLLDNAMKAADGTNSFAGDDLVKAVAERLPSERSFEVYIGIKGILDTVMPFVAMMGMGGDFTPAENLNPIGIAGTTHTGGVRVSIVVPTSVLDTFRQLGEAFGPMMGGNMDQEEDDGEPQF